MTPISEPTNQPSRLAATLEGRAGVAVIRSRNHPLTRGLVVAADSAHPLRRGDRCSRLWQAGDCSRLDRLFRPIA